MSNLIFFFTTWQFSLDRLDEGCYIENMGVLIALYFIMFFTGCTAALSAAILYLTIKSGATKNAPPTFTVQSPGVVYMDAKHEAAVSENVNIEE